MHLPVALATAFCVVSGMGAGGGYANAFLYAALVPLLPALFWGAYRDDLRGRIKARWDALKTYRPTTDPIPWSSTCLFVVLPTALFYVSNGKTIGAGDTLPVMPTAVSLVTDGDYRLDEFCRDGSPGKMFNLERADGFYLRSAGDHIYTNYPAGMTVFALPVAVLARISGANFDDPRVMFRLEKVTAVWVGSIGIGLFFLVALQIAPPWPTLVMTAMLATGSTMSTTVGQALWQHGGVVLWASLAILVEFRSSPRPTLRGVLVEGFACGMMPVCRLSSATILVPLGIWMFARAPKRAALVVGVALLTALPFSLMYQSIYGSPLGPSTSQMQSGVWSRSVIASLYGVLFSPSRGLLVYQPWVVLGLFGLKPAMRRFSGSRIAQEPRNWRTFCIVAIGLQVALNTGWMNWWGGWCWGSRLLTEAVPLCALLALPAVAVLWERRWGRGVVIGLGLLAFLMHVPCLYFGANDWNYVEDIDRNLEMLGSWSRPPFLHPFRG